MFTPPVHGFAGSSPLTRGKQDAGRPQFRNEGFIPTHAGRTSSFSWLLRRSADHPRSREENFLGLIAILIIVSHPPLTRGKPQFGHDRRGMGRLIPAHAGKTKRRRSRRPEWPTHPRSRGENMSRKKQGSPVSGSSPLTRGKRWWRPPPSTRCGLIPAHAGKTSCSGWRWVARRAHPRSRGENRTGVPRRVPAGGSSPLTRENGVSTASSRQSSGTPPPTRGKRLRCADNRLDLGLIPAHAGKTRTRRPGSTGTGAHPRSRGENKAVR